MIQNFICLRCKSRFSAEEAANTSCPYCTSDNIKIYKSSGGKYIVATVCFLMFAAAGFFFPLHIFIKDKREIPIVEIHNQNDIAGQQNVLATTTSEEDKTAGRQPKILSISEPVLKGGKYEVKVAAEVDNGKLKYEIRNEPGYELVQSNNSGVFSSIPYSESGMYRVEVINSTYPDNKDYQIIAGFEKPVETVPSIKKVSKEELETMINNKDMNALKQCSRSARIVVVNPEEAGQSPADYNGVLLNLKMEVWEKVVVESISYNAQNYVVSVKIRVIPK